MFTDAKALSKAQLETGTLFAPKFDADGLIPCITLDHARGDVLMFAWMSAESLQQTLAEGVMVYWSRSRKALWRKGDTSGQIQTLVEMQVDCDQDVLIARVTVGGDGGACHTGARSCFYRVVTHSLDGGYALEPVTPPKPGSAADDPSR